MNEIKTIGLIGYGKFAKLMDKVLSEELPDVEIKISSRSNQVDGKKFFSFEEVCKTDLLIPTVPINAFEKTIQMSLQHLKPGGIVMDVCSIKSYPKKIMTDLLPKETQAICTHPMFGPESYKNNNDSVKGLNMMIENLNCDPAMYKQILKFLRNLELEIIEIDSEEHDRLASEFQFTTLFTALELKHLGIKRTDIDTASAARMHDFIERVGVDLEIVADMYEYNPYCHAQLENLEASFNKIKDKVVNRNYD